MSKKVSIIIPCYNCEQTVSQAVASALEQTYRDIEVIAVDDGSKDGTGVLLDRLAKASPYLKILHQANAGPSAARNAGLNVASGEYILFLDADDWLEPRCVETALSAAEVNDADIVFFNHFNEYPDRSIRHVVIDGKKQPSLFEMRLATDWGKLYKSACIGSERHDPKIRISEDVEFNFRVYRKVRKAIFLTDFLYHYRYSEGSEVHGYKPGTSDKFLLPINKLHSLFVECEDSAELRRAYYSFAAIAYIVTCQNEIVQKPGAGFFEIRRGLKAFGSTDWVLELFEHLSEVDVPPTRKFLPVCGKIGLYSGIILAVKVRRTVKS